MEPKPSPPPAATPRRRGAATKRKERAASAALSASPPPKRQARERAPVGPLPVPPPPPPPQPPAPRSRPAASKSRRKPARKKAPRRSVNPPREQQQEEAAQAAPSPPPPPPPRPSLEQEIEAVLSRGAGVHVVPTFAGWFSWKEIHPIEKQMLATFFDGKSERRTPEIYLGIRNLIMRKFHFNPEVHLESKDLSELSIGEMDARLEILEFLAHWGLVNFHPCPPVAEDCKLVESKSSADTAEEISLIEKLVQFETVHSYLVPVSKKAEIISPVQFTSFFSQPKLAEDAITAAESSVEYHCNSCSVDCSRKRYHCRTQVDFDLCSDCYNEGKFDEVMSKTDFILMEYAEVPGSGGSNWTDQETLLLLEALEIFKGKEWDEIAEHVATKTKEQCMLYFLQMPIFDSFLDGEDFNETPQKITEQDSAETGTLGVPEDMDVGDNAEGKESTDEKTYKKANANSSETGTKLADQSVSAKENTMNLGDNDLVSSSIVDESNKSSLMDLANMKKSADTDVSGEQASNIVTGVLRSTFEAVGHFLGKDDLGSFAEAGSPVMALAGFLASLVEHDDAVTSCCSSLRAISAISPALQLATGHCFILPDPPSNLKDLTSNYSPCTGGECQGGADGTRNVNDTDKDSSKREEGALTLEKEDASQKVHLELSNTEVPFVEGPQAEVKSNSTKDSDNQTAKVETTVASDKMRDGCNTIPCSATSNNTNEPSSITSQETSAASTNATTNSERLEGGKSSSKELPDDDSPSQGKVEPKEIEHAPMALSSMQQHKSNQTGNGNTEELNSNKNIAAAADPLVRLQRAAVTAISAAAVKAKFLVEQEEGHVRRLAELVIEKQFQKMETKMSFLAEVENLVLRSRELTEKMRNKLMLERNAIIASRMAAAASRTNQHRAPETRLPVALVRQLRHP
ncbi:SWI/SNF complex subunit SWI3D-like [Panicum miliaceum]|uniref:SWI/SNF complex subunit SWI3D-like n=1 Tax=Panicum miliaceum TaxID=4540 RepID=A0A3L6Q603_PANMI|nr:SWI/SNF complex subunit SWI3D-like [Panicum miliaceum]